METMKMAEGLARVWELEEDSNGFNAPEKNANVDNPKRNGNVC
jgi:hypothetical protein